MPGFYYTYFTPSEPQTGEVITFYAEGMPSVPFGASWDFGDGGTATGLVVTHTYAAPGDYLYSAVLSTNAGPVRITDRPITVSEPSVVYTASFSSTANVGYAIFRPYLTDTSTPPSDTREWIVNGIVQSDFSTWGAVFYDENPSQAVTLRAYWNSGTVMRETTQYFNVLATPKPRFSVGPIAGFAPFTATITDISGPASLSPLYDPVAWAYTMNTLGPRVFTQNGEFEYLPGLWGSFATSAYITYPLPLPLELQINVLTPNIAYVVGPRVEVLHPNQRPGEGITVSENTLFLPVKKVSDEEFASIQMRGVTNALPTTVLDNGGYPDRQLYFWPIPNDSSKAIELWMWEPLVIQDLDTELNLPPGYERYYIYALAMELCDIFGKQPTREIVSSLSEAESSIKILNQINFTSKTSNVAKELNRSNRAYNIIDFKSGANMLPRNDE